jgi:hypothetical protein
VTLVNRPSFVPRYALCGGALVGALVGSQGAIAHAEPWRIVMVPDTQHYVDDSDNVDDFMTEMQWIADNVAPLDIAFVSHIGDVVQHGSSNTEWNRAEAAMDLIDGRVPYSVAIGDHDYVTEEDRSSGAPQYVARFGASRYAGRPWYGGSSPDQKSHYQLFSAGGRTFLHLTLEWEVPGTVDDPSTALGWGKQILDHHPHVPTIISTHSNLWDRSGEKGRTNAIEERDANGNSAEMVWTELIGNHPQVFMMLNGHSHRGSSQYDPTDPDDDPAGPSTDGEFHQVSTNWHGLPVYEMLADYQDYPNGGDGWVRIITFEEGAGAGGLDRIRVQTYSTTHDAYQTDSLSQFHFDLSFAQRFDAIPAPMPLERATFRAGQDAYVWQNTPATNYGSSASINIDTSDSGAQQGLIRFDAGFGSTIPAGAQIAHAELRVALTDSGTGFRLHRMRTAWSEGTVTWSSLTGGVSAGADAENAPDLTTFEDLSEGESPGYSVFDVTASVRAWMQGEANHGWAIMPQNSDKLIFDSFEGTRKPELVVFYLPSASIHRVTVTAGDDTYLWRGQAQQNFGADTRVRIDYSDGQTSSSGIMPMQGLVRFNVQGALPSGARITRAELRLRLTDSGNGFRLHRMLVPWGELTATWNGFGEGIDDDGSEAAADPDFITSDFLTEPATAGYLAMVVTDAVRAWAAGQANHGWVLLPLGDDKLLIESFEGTELRPQLVIEYTAP